MTPLPEKALMSSTGGGLFAFRPGFTGHEIMTFQFSSSSNRSAWAICSPRFTAILTLGCETPSFLDSLVAPNPNLLTAH